MEEVTVSYQRDCAQPPEGAHPWGCKGNGGWPWYQKGPVGPSGKDRIPGGYACGWLEKGWETPAFFLLLSSQELLVPHSVNGTPPTIGTPPTSWQESLINGVCYNMLQKGQGVQKMYVRADM